MMRPFVDPERFMRILIVAAVAAGLAGCAVPLPTFFRVPVVQGNVVDTDKVAQLEIGMTPPQVRYLLGTPLVSSAFDRDRWDYVFYYRDRNGREHESQLSLHFDEGKLARIDGNETYQAILPEASGDIEPGDVEPVGPEPAAADPMPTEPVGPGTPP